MNNTLIGFVAFSIIILIGLPLANGEAHGGLNVIEIKTYEGANADIQKYYEIWEIPIEFPVRDNGVSCVTDYSVSPIKKICTWTALVTMEELENDYTYDKDTGTMRPTADVEAEAIANCEADKNCPLGYYEPDVELTYWEKIAETISPDTESPTDKELIDKINKMLGAQCYQGIGTTAGSQQARSFDIPTVVIDGKTVLDTSTNSKNLNLKGILGAIERAVRECVAQIVLLDTQGGIMSSVDTNFAYCDTVDLKDTTQLAQCGKTYNHQTNAQDVPVWSQARVNEEANRDIDTFKWTLLEDVCKGYYQHSYKLIFQECRDYFLSLGAEYESYAKKQSMKYYDDSGFQDFKDNGEAKQLEKIKQDLRDKFNRSHN